MKGAKKVIGSTILILLLVLQTVASGGAFTSHAAEKTVTLVGDLQNELGAKNDWDPADAATIMVKQADGTYKFTGKLPAGTYEYKVAINQSWDENYGVNGEAGGGNYKLVLDQEKVVTFVYNDSTHTVTIPVALDKDKLPRLVGNIQPAIHAGEEWKPDQSTAIFEDENGDNIYTYKVLVPKGQYEYKVVLGKTWDDAAYPTDNAKLVVVKDTEVTFFYNHDTKQVSTNYDSGLPDGSIQMNALFHNTWDPAYRMPFGAIEAGKSVKLRLQAKKGDLTGAKVQLKNYDKGTTSTEEMSYAGWTQVDGKNVELWETTVTPKEKGVYGYKFIARDGTAVAEYGEDTQEGKTGVATEKNANLFQMTVYDPTFKTPDWMKKAVVYQIFPDRFFNGNPKNDAAKSNARGKEPIEHMKWSDLPDNPRLASEEAYKGDNIWSNDFFGGDIAGIQKKLDYIQSLGVNTLYLNPIASAASNHKYDATDYKAIDPMFGSPQEFDAFTKELKKRKMHLILDGVFNHVGDDSVYFDRYGKYPTVGAYEYWARIYDLMNSKKLTEAEAKKEAEAQFIKEGQVFSPYGFQNWFNIENVKTNGVYKYQAWWGFDSLPEIKSVPGAKVPYNSELNNTNFAKYIMYDKDSVAKSWLQRGASGWRLDVANEVDPEFWREFRHELKTGKGEEPLILGEIWDDASKYFLGDLYDSVMNYRFRGTMLDYLKNGKAENAYDQLQAVEEDYPKEAFYALMNLMGSHDTARAVFLLGNGTDTSERAEYDKKYDYELGVQRLKLASIFQMGYPGAPTIYYGDEAGVTGSKDPDNRRVYPWGHEDKALVAHYQKVGKARKANADLFALGDLKTLYAKGDIIAYARTNEKKAAVVIVNRGNEEQTVTIDVKDVATNGALFVDQLKFAYHTTVKDGKLTVTIPAMNGRMLVANELPKQQAFVKNVAVTESNHTATLTWTGNAKAYKVYQTTINGAFYKEVQNTSSGRAVISNLENGRSYYFAVTAIDKYGNESKQVVTKAVIPHVPLTNNYTISNMTKLTNGVIDLAKPQTVSADIMIKGVTEKEQGEGLLVQLHVKEPGHTKWTILPAGYVGQNGDANTFQGEFLPINQGAYEVKVALSTDAGRTWVWSNAQTVTFAKGTDAEPPAKSVTLSNPQQESGQVNLSWNINEAKDPYMIEIIRNGSVIERSTDVKMTAYKDLNVVNGQSYEYAVNVYDQAGNVVTSNAVTVEPDLVLVKVTFKLHAPDYTSQNAKITIPGSINGWNTTAFEMTRGGAVTNDYQYTFEAQEGEVLTYKYVKDNSWDKEGLPDHTPSNKSDDDVSYYGYGAQGTDLKVVVTNQGGNQMVIEDTILRWIDMPVVITSHTDGQTVSTDTITLKGTAIKGGTLTINGEKVTINEDMTFTHTVQLRSGENPLTIKIEPSEKAKDDIFKNDGSAIEKNTKTMTFTITKK